MTWFHEIVMLLIAWVLLCKVSRISGQLEKIDEHTSGIETTEDELDDEIRLMEIEEEAIAAIQADRAKAGG